MHTPYSGDFSATSRNIIKQEFSGNATSYGPFLGVEIGNYQFQGRLGCQYTYIKAGLAKKDFAIGGGEFSFTFGRKKKKLPGAT